MRVKVLFFKFKCDEFIKESGHKLRGYFANKFSGYTLIHHHLDNNKLLYKSPLIQYKILKGEPWVLGINEGTDILQKIYEEIDYLKFGDEVHQIREKHIILRTEEFGIVNKNDLNISNDSNGLNSFIHYKFLTPWLALNQENYKKYISSSSSNRLKLLEKVLIGNILSMAKSLDYVVLEEIKVQTKLRKVETKLKDTPFTGFLGEFKANFSLPDYIGLGKSVSRGFGTIVKMGNGK